MRMLPMLGVSIVAPRPPAGYSRAVRRKSAKRTFARKPRARMLGQLDGIRDQDERVTELRAELTIISTQLKEGDPMIGAAARRLRHVAV